MRWIGYLLGTLLLLVVAAVAVLALMPTAWLAERAETFAAQSLGLPLEIGELELDVLSSTPGVRATDVSLGDGAGGTIVSGADVAVSVDAGNLLGGELVLDEVRLADAEVNLVVDENGQGNWESLLPLPGGETATEEEGEEGGGPAVPAIRSIEVENLGVDYVNRQLGRELSLELSASGSTTDPERPTVIDATGRIDEVPLEADVELASLGELAESLDELAVDADVRLGDTRFGIEGIVGDPRTLADFDLEFAVSAPDVRDIESIVGVPLPVLPPFELDGALRREGDDIVLRRFDGRLGDSDLEGDVRLDPTTTPPTLYANLISRTLDLDDIAGVIGNRPDPDETAPPELEDEKAELLPDTPLELRPLVQAFNGAVRYRALEVRSPAYPLESIAARLEIDGDELVLSPLEIGVGGGTIEGSVDLDVRPIPAEGQVELRIRGIDLKEIMRALEIDDDSFGTLGGRAKYWISGNSIRSFFADADGGLFLVMTGGKLDALLTELTSIDLLESVTLLLDPGKQLTEINCGYVDLQTADGSTDIATFVLDTADTVFLADGRFDLAEESFDIAFEPHPRDPSLLEINAGVRVSGTVDDFSVVPGIELGARAAAAAALAAVAAPAAALLAFVDTGGAQDSPYCDGLDGALE